MTVLYALPLWAVRKKSSTGGTERDERMTTFEWTDYLDPKQEQ